MAEALTPSAAPSAPRAEFCTSCGIRLLERGKVQFPCPECTRSIGRCWRCRSQAIIYRCPSCGFSGP